MMNEITITNHGNSYTFDPSDTGALEEVLDDHWNDGYDAGRDDYDDTVPFQDGYQKGLEDSPVRYHLVYALIDDFILRIDIDTTLADKSPVEVLEELYYAIEREEYNND